MRTITTSQGTVEVRDKEEMKAEDRKRLIAAIVTSAASGAVLSEAHHRYGNPFRIKRLSSLLDRIIELDTPV